MGSDHKALHYRDHAGATGYIALNYNEFFLKKEWDYFFEKSST
jgi:hypothetical protein